jgi:hypothetical protein
MADCPFCRKAVDPLATRCPHCGGTIQLTPFEPAAPTFYGAVLAPALGAALMSVIFWILSPFSGFFLHVALGGATDLGLRDYMVDVRTMVDIALVTMALSALCGWLRYREESLFLSLLSFCTPFIAPMLLVVAFQAVAVSASL